MPRRKAYTKVEKKNQVRADHVKGMGDVVFKGFQCLNPECTNFIFVKNDDLYSVFSVRCEKCGMVITPDAETKFYDYKLIKNGKVIEKGKFVTLHEDFVEEAQKYKYCIVCNTIKPLEYFDQHAARQSGRQGECRLCKKLYNSIKNQTRLTDQHREAAQKRRLYMDLSGGERIDSEKIFKRFGNKCFKCGRDLSGVTDVKERPMDHTLPVFYLWPLTTQSATSLCRKHNGEKAGKWPSAYYGLAELKRLSVLTGIAYEVLAGPPIYNPQAIVSFKKKGFVDTLLAKYGPYMDEIIKLRNRLIKDTAFDMFTYSKDISEDWVRKADAARKIKKSKS